VNRLEDVCRRFAVPRAGEAALAAILALQADDPEASTTVREPAVAADRHVADSLVALSLPEVRGGRCIADLGAGAGWPGLALAAALPNAHVRLVESAIRHCRYLERAVAAAGLANAEVVHARAEDWPEGIGAHDVVTARALASLPVLCEYAAPLLTPDGVLVAWKGAVESAESAAGARAAEEVGLEPVAVHRVDPYPDAQHATLHVFRKVRPTPPRFPRRPGMAVKRPLGGRSA
jgi:16S rRNA (guanine527-N7)-methyltransferase